MWWLLGADWKEFHSKSAKSLWSWANGNYEKKLLGRLIKEAIDEKKNKDCCKKMKQI